MYDEGNYVARITGQILGESKTKRTPQFCLQFELLGILDPSEPEQMFACPTGERTLYMYITDTTIERFRDDLRSLGYTKSSLKYIDPRENDCHDFSGQEIRVTCEHEEYQGQSKERWRLTGAGGGIKAMKAIDAKETRRLDALFGKYFKDTTPAPAAPPASVPEKAHTKSRAPAKSLEEVNAELQAAGADDDIPFALVPFLAMIAGMSGFIA